MAVISARKNWMTFLLYKRYASWFSKLTSISSLLLIVFLGAGFLISFFDAGEILADSKEIWNL